MGRILVVLHNSPRFLKTQKTRFLDQQAKIVDDFRFDANSSTRECILRCSRDSIRKNVKKNYFCGSFDPQNKVCFKTPHRPLLIFHLEIFFQWIFMKFLSIFERFLFFWVLLIFHFKKNLFMNFHKIYKYFRKIFGFLSHILIFHLL